MFKNLAHPGVPSHTKPCEVIKPQRLKVFLLIKPIAVRASILVMEIGAELAEAMDVARAMAASRGEGSSMQEMAAGEARALVQVKRMKTGVGLQAGASSNNNVPVDGGSSSGIGGAQAESANSPRAMQRLECGKHRGKCFQDVAREDRRYCANVMTNMTALRACETGLRQFKAYLMQSFGGVLPFGKHKGKYFEEVRRDDPEYCAWARGLLSPKGAMKEFVDYLNSQGPALEESSLDESSLETISSSCMSEGREEEGAAGNEMPTSTREEDCIAKRISDACPVDNVCGDENGASSACSVCLIAPVVMAFAPCGHKAVCSACGARFLGKPCPICRKTVTMALRIYDV